MSIFKELHEALEHLGDECDEVERGHDIEMRRWLFLADVICALKKYEILLPVIKGAPNTDTPRREFISAVIKILEGLE